MPQCRSCPARVMFVLSATTGARMILDEEPVPDGNVVIENGRARVVPKADLFTADAPVPRYKDHHATCPKAHEWRRSKAK